MEESLREEEKRGEARGTTAENVALEWQWPDLCFQQRPSMLQTS